MSLGNILALQAQRNAHRIFGFDAIHRYLQRQKRDHAKGATNTIATVNRWTGEPHEHRREIARHDRRLFRAFAKQGY